MRVGIDLVDLGRIESLLERKPRFLERYFTEGERAYIGEGKARVQRTGAAFAVKEALSKAMGTGIAGFDFQEVELTHLESGEPKVVLHGRALELFHRKGFTAIRCSISHTDAASAAVVIIEGGDE